MKQWEKETDHRHRMESRDLWQVSIEAILGKVFALIFVSAALAVSAYALYLGHEWAAAFLGGGTIASIVWAFAKVNRPTK